MEAPSCHESKNKYLDSKCYLRLKRYFDYYNKFSCDKSLLKKIVESANITSNNKLDQNEIFGNIKQHLNGDGVFSIQNPTECCRYINFWLNKEVQEKLHHLYTDSSFKIFQDFLKSYHTHKKSRKCKTDIGYIDSYVLQKMKALYDLYNKYENLLNHKQWYGDSSCTTLLNMSRTYNDSISYHVENDVDFFNRLKVFKKLIDDNILHKYQCTEQIHFLEPDLFIPTELKRLEQERQAKIKPNTSSLPSGESLTLQDLDTTGITRSSEGHNLPETPKEKEPGLPVLETEQNRQGLPENGPFKEENELREYREPSALTGTIGRLRNNGEVKHSMDSSYSTDLGHTQSLNLPNIYFSSPDTEDHAPHVERESRNVPETFLGTLQNTVSGIVQNVDPVPVVGVSGGMGALFLLFRYTPVGTYFRGGRGRAHRIPRSFNGQFLGAFPDFQDYEVRHIGYGQMHPLAE